MSSSTVVRQARRAGRAAGRSRDGPDAERALHVPRRPWSARSPGRVVRPGRPAGSSTRPRVRGGDRGDRATSAVGPVPRAARRAATRCVRGGPRTPGEARRPRVARPGRGRRGSTSSTGEPRTAACRRRRGLLPRALDGRRRRLGDRDRRRPRPNVRDAAAAAGVRRLVYLGGLGRRRRRPLAAPALAATRSGGSWPRGRSRSPSCGPRSSSARAARRSRCCATSSRCCRS